MSASFVDSGTKKASSYTRTVVRINSEKEWNETKKPIDRGELIAVSDSNQLKLGDGVTPFKDLPVIGGGGSGGTSDYRNLSNKPQINGNVLSGDQSSADLGLASTSDIQTLTDTKADKKELTNYATKSDLSTKQDNLPSQSGNAGKVLSTTGTALEWIDSPKTAVYIED